MNVIQSFELENIVYFKEPTRFEFTKGLTFIQGRNLQRRGPSASNGSGKSLLFGVLPNLLFDSHPTITKNVRSVQRQLYAKGSRAALKFSRGKHNYEYEKAGSKTRISRDGNDLKSRIARDQLQSLIGLSEEEFYSTVYLDSRRNNQFQLGTGADRFAFLTQVFRLQEIDDLRKHINRSITDLSSDGRLLEQTVVDLSDVSAKLKALPKVSKEQADEAAAWLQRSSEKVQRLTALQHQWDNWNRYTKALDDLAELKKPDSTVSELTALIEAHIAYNAACKAVEKTLANTDSWKKELRKLDAVDAAILPDMQKTKASLQAVSTPTEPTGDLAAARKLAKKITLEKAQRIASAASAKAKVLQDQLDEFQTEVGDSDTCPTCHSTLSAKTKKSITSQFTTGIQEQKERAKKAQRIVDAHALVIQHTEYVTALQEYKVYVRARKVVDAYPFEAARRKLELVSLLQSSQSANSLPKKPVGDLKTLQKALRSARDYKAAKKLAESLTVKKPDAAVDHDAIRKLNEEVSQRMSLLPELQATLAERRSLRAQTQELEKRRAEIASRTDDLPVYKMLQDAYGVKGIKVLMIQRIAKALEKNLNRYSRQIFAEDFRFAFDVEDGKFNVWVTRKVGKKEVVSDIRHMSGAESRLFIFLFVLSLLPLIPDARRMSILVLDEPDANMDADTREVFRDALLPRLAKIVPSVVVISPNKDSVPHHSRVFTVVKDKGHSRLVEGTIT